MNKALDMFFVQQTKAIEFAEYMAKAAEDVITAIDNHNLAIEAYKCAEKIAIDPAELALDDANEKLAEGLRRLHSAIYEFRKRIPQKPDASLSGLAAEGN